MPDLAPIRARLTEPLRTFTQRGQIRRDAYDLLGEVERLRARVVELEAKYCTHNVAAVLMADGNNALRGPR